ncbi:MAG: ABC transporter permease subunit [Pirellulales bacterium]
MRFVVRRTVWMIVTLWAVFTVSFFLMRNTSGNPFDGDRKLEPAVRAMLEKRYDLDKPQWEQYLLEMKRYVFELDLGYSMKQKDYSVNQIIAEGWPISAALGVLALTLAAAVGITAGTIAAVRRGTYVDTTVIGISTLGIALPNFVLAGLAIIAFAFLIPLFPAAGWGRWEHLVLPACCLAAPYAAYIARLTRTGMLEVLNQDFIRTAIAKGLPARTVVLRHALRGALLPVATYLGPAAAGILTGSMVVEQAFAIPGLGTHFVFAALQYDYTLCLGLVMLYTVVLYTLNFVVDLTYAVLDPRVKLE